MIARLPSDPSFELIEKAGAKVETSKEGHAVSNGTVWVSGEIPRVTEYETGLLGGVRWFKSENNGQGGWLKEEVISLLAFYFGYVLIERQHIMDERYACIDVAGKGLVIFSA